MAVKKITWIVFSVCMGAVVIIAAIFAADRFGSKPPSPDSLIESNPVLYVSVANIRQNRLTMLMNEPYRKIVRGKAGREAGVLFLQSLGMPAPEKMSARGKRFLSNMLLGDGFSAAMYMTGDGVHDFVIVSPAGVLRRAALRLVTLMPQAGKRIAVIREGGGSHTCLRAPGSRRVYFGVKRKCFIASSNLRRFKAGLELAEGGAGEIVPLNRSDGYRKVRAAARADGALFFAYVPDKNRFAVGKSINAGGISLTIKKDAVEAVAVGGVIEQAKKSEREPFRSAHSFPADADLVWETGNFGRAWNNLFLETEANAGRLAAFFKKNYGMDYDDEFSKYFRGDVSAFVKSVSTVTDGTPVPNTVIAIGATEPEKAFAAFDRMITGSMSSRYEKQELNVYKTKVIRFRNVDKKAALSPSYTAFDGVIYFSLRYDDIKKILNVRNGFAASLFDTPEFSRYAAAATKEALLSVYAPGARLSLLSRDYVVGVVKVSQGFFSEEMQKIFLPAAENLALAGELTGVTNIADGFVVTEMKLKWKRQAEQ